MLIRPLLERVQEVLNVFDGKSTDPKKKKWINSGYYIRRKEKELGLTLQEMRELVTKETKKNEEKEQSLTTEQILAGVVRGIVQFIDTRKDSKVLSYRTQVKDDSKSTPPFAAVHCTFAGKEYIISFTPTDL